MKRQESPCVARARAGLAGAALLLALALDGSGSGLAAESDDGSAPSFVGPLGTFDRAQLRRGYQVHTETCTGCHGLSRIRFADFEEVGGLELSPEEVVELSRVFSIIDGPDDDGEMFWRSAQPRDFFPSPFLNEAAARSANAGAYPLDLSVLAAGRGVDSRVPWFLESVEWFEDLLTGRYPRGVEEIHAILTGYGEPPDGLEAPEGASYNIAVPVGWTQMPQPLYDDSVEYPQNLDDDPENDIPTTVAQQAEDVSAFLLWTAQPRIAERQKIVLRIYVNLAIVLALIYLTWNRLWGRRRADSEAPSRLRTQ